MTATFRRTQVLALLLAFLTAGPLLAGKGDKGGKPDPAPEGPPPAGTIYLEQNATYPFRETLGMNSDGSGKFFALPAQDEDHVYVGAPSRGLYEGRPIWLATVNLGLLYPGHNELFAFRATGDGDVESVQITEINPDFTIDFSGAQWSNDGNDVFLSWIGFDHGPRLSGDGDAEKGLFRLHVSADDLALAFDLDEWPPYGPMAVETVLLDDGLGVSQHHSWSPDGTLVTYGLKSLNGP